ncbi:peptidoglycan-binding protein [Kitasatospora sp. NPDC056800]|uniref:peptidoglycan-binding protein n=1 Tax=Kitasatospora sp. NPDC056800 TaxID=3345948 RepID=UPI0036D03215
MSLDSMLAECRKWISQGYKEGRNNDTTFGRWYGLNNEPWCDMWISYCASASGNADVIGRFAYCPSHVNWFKQRGQWSEYPRVGAIVFYDWDGDGVADHVGIVESFTDTTITALEGNTSSGNAGSQSNGDGCYRRVRPRKVRQVLGYGYPAYSGNSTPAPKPPTPPAGVPAWPGRYLKLTRPYMTGEDVRTFQARLKARTWQIDADGAFGPASDSITRQFQARHGLEVDGVVGPNTWAEAWRG